MIVNDASSRKHGLSSSTKAEKTEKPKWEERVKQQVAKGNLTGITCKLYSSKIKEDTDTTIPCICGRLLRQHSFTGDPVKVAGLNFDARWHAAENSASVVYGKLKNGARFIRCDKEVPNLMKTLCQLIVDDVGETNKPDLLMCCYGGAEYFAMTDSLEKEFMNGIGEVATTKRVWVLTTGLNKGVSSVVGQSLHRHFLVNKKASKPTIIGMASWGTVTPRTREVLKFQASKDTIDTLDVTLKAIGGKRPITMLSEVEGKTLDKNHTHFLLLDDGPLNHHLTDGPRSDFVNNACKITDCCTITIIVEGGFNTLQVIINDLEASRPVIIIQGSGRLANVLGALLKETEDDKKNIPEVERIQYYLRKYPQLDPSTEYSESESIKSIKKIFKPEYRQYLKRFQLKTDENGENDISLTDTIFRAVLEAYASKKKGWERLLQLAVNWNCVGGAHDILKRIKDQRKYYNTLFELALKSNRPVFVDYFLRRYHDPMETTKFMDYNNNKQKNLNSPAKTMRSSSIASIATNNPTVISAYDQIVHMIPLTEPIEEEKISIAYALHFIVEELYVEELYVNELYVDELYVDELYTKNTNTLVKKCDVPKTLDELDRNYSKLIGLYAESFYFERDTSKRLLRDLKPDSWKSTNKVSSYNKNQNTEITIDELVKRYTIEKMYEKQEMLRDLFLWSVYCGYADIAFVFLLQLKSRIGATLLAISMARRLSLHADNLDTRHTYEEQAKLYEIYASDCIKACHSCNERLACQLLLRELPIYGNVTCMQIAIASRIQPFINTDTFDQVLNRQWYGQLDSGSNKPWWYKCNFIFTFCLFGILAPILDYRPAEVVDKPEQQYEKDDTNSKNKPDRRARWKYIQDKPIEGVTWRQKFKIDAWFQKFKIFHHSPVVKLSYHFLIYVWFLLVFSYMMLFHISSDNNETNWTEIYVFITVTAMLIEDLRKVAVEYHTQMLERWHVRNAWILSLYATPYILFYIGFGLHMGSKTSSDYFTPAKIVLALDLEIWYLFSLRFASAVKLLGPKLFMIRNMMRDLLAFICLIFVCIAAYGVVSRTLYTSDPIEFTADSIFTSIFYRPYWLLYSTADDEKNGLDDAISSNTSTSDQVAGAKATHVLLTFHMIFINILLLNLLIAVFNFSIQEVQDKNEFYWRYQRYELLREYFEKPLFAFPPLSLLVYICLVFDFWVLKGTTCRVFKRHATLEWNDRWTDFEHAATFEYARNYVEKNYRQQGKKWISPLQVTPDNASPETNTELSNATPENVVQTKRIPEMKSQSAMRTRRLFPIDLSSSNA